SARISPSLISWLEQICWRAKRRSSPFFSRPTITRPGFTLTCMPSSFCFDIYSYYILQIDGTGFFESKTLFQPLQKFLYQPFTIAGTIIRLALVAPFLAGRRE